MLPMNLALQGGNAGPSNSDQQTPAVFQDGPFQVGGSGNSARAADQATAAAAPPSYGFPVDYAPGYGSAVPLSTTTIVLGGLACLVLLLLTRR